MKVRTVIGKAFRVPSKGIKISLGWKFACCLFSMVLLSTSLSAQFININIDIPPKTGLVNRESLETAFNENASTAVDLTGKIFALGISSSENFQIIASLTQPGYFKNEQGDSIKAQSTLAFRNDGKNALPKMFFKDRIQFPMSNSNLLIDYMKDEPQSINAYIFIKTDTEDIPNSTSVFSGEIKLTIEYN